MPRRVRSPSFLATLGLFLIGTFCLLPADPALADTWVCPGPKKTRLYTDKGGPGCRKLVGPGTVQYYKGPIQPVSETSVTVPPALPLPSASIERKPPPFSAITGQVPFLMVNKLSSAQQQQGTYLANAGEMGWVDLAISYVEAGTGPEASTDSHFGGGIDASLRTATHAAAKAVGYDPRFLKVHLSIRTSFLQRRLYIDGPSAGAVMAVGIASALLGDTLRPDVCMSGTINADLTVGWVGGLEEKIKGCRHFNNREMILPSGQTTMDLTLKGMGYEIKLTEVNTLPEAYQAATGQSLRSVPPY